MRIATVGIPTSYKITRSLRFDSASTAILSKSYGSSSGTSNARRKATFSLWVKRGRLDQYEGLFGFAYSGSGASQNIVHLSFGTTNKLILDHQVSNTSTFAFLTTPVFRDVTGWMHIVLQVDTTQVTASNRLKLWVNGSQITAFDSITYPTQDYDTLFGQASNHRIGSLDGGGAAYLPFGGYMANFHYCDGQTKVATDFARVDSVTGAWMPKAYNGLYGSHGFFLDFSDNSAATSSALGKDRSGNGNDWTPVNMSVSLGAGNDSMTDVPTTYVDGKNGRGNYCTLNPLARSSAATVSGGGLSVSISGSGGAGDAIASTMSVGSGKWYAEATVTSVVSAGIPRIGVWAGGVLPNSGAYTWGVPGYYSYGYDYRGDNGTKSNNNSASAYGSTYTTNDVIGIAIDCAAGKIWFSKNGVWQNSGDPAAGTSQAFSGLAGMITIGVGNGNNGGTVSYAMNFGQQGQDATNVFKYAPPSGFKAICTANFAAPAVLKPSTSFDVVQYSGTGSSQSISTLGFSPNLVWIKSKGSDSHRLFDANRGATVELSSNSSSGETTVATGLTSFNSNGFTVGTSVGTGVNLSGSNYVAWCWDEAAASGVDVVTYTGNGATQNIAHSLGVAPRMMIVKARASATNPNWFVYHAELPTPATSRIYLNSTLGSSSGSSAWNSAAPGASTFSVGTDLSQNTINYVAYLFAEIPQFSRIGRYIGNGSADGPYVYCGFRPRFILCRVNTTASWVLFDASRSTSNPCSLYLLAESNATESTFEQLDILATGFKVRSSSAGGINSGGVDTIFIAFAESPLLSARAR